MDGQKPAETMTNMPVLIQEENSDNIDKSPAVEVAISDSESRCGLCNHGHIKNALEGGKLYRVLNKGQESFVHYFCMLFTAYSRQIGAETEAEIQTGFLGGMNGNSNLNYKLPLPLKA